MMTLQQKSVSKAFGIKYEIHKEAFQILEAYYKPGEFNEGRKKWYGCQKMQT